MGAEGSVLKSVEVGESFSQIPSLSKIWTTVAPARYFQSPATVFIKEFDEEEDLTEGKKFLECGIQTLKSLRHPRIVKYVDGSVTSVNACLIVERLRPLEYSLDVGFEKDEILSGLCDIFEAVLFLHEKAGLSHNNIGPVSIFISPDGAWKLGSFECAQRLENCLHWCQTEFAKHAKDDNFIPPEDQQMMYSNVPVYARDVYGLGKLVEFLTPMLQDLLDEGQKGDINQFIQWLTTEEAAKRPPLIETNWKQIFRNDLYDIGDFLMELPLKTLEEKAAFFRQLISKLERLSPQVVAKRLSKSLLSRFVLLESEAVENFLPRFLSFEEDDTGLLSAHLFKQYVVPELKKVFCVHETAVRLALLQYFARYCQAFDENTLKDLILPELLLGMKDSDETIVAASMRCLAELVPLLGAEAVTGLKHTKYFCEGRPRVPFEGQVPDLSKLTSVKDAFSSSTESSLKEPRKLPLASPKKEAKPERKPMVIESKKSTPLKLSTPIKRPDPSEPFPETAPSPEPSSTPTYIEAVPLADENDETEDLDWVDWDMDDPQGPKDIPVQSPTQLEPPFTSSTPIFPKFERPTSSKEEARKASLNQSKPLGAEFDVMAIEVVAPKSGSIEDDLFAEMAPKITPARPQLKMEEVAPKPLSSSKFQASATADDQDAGWDDAQLNDEE